MNDFTYIANIKCRILFGFQWAALLWAFFLLWLPVYGQIPLTTNSFRSNLPDNGIGDWEDIESWSVWDGAGWMPATIPPNNTNDVFITKGNEIRLTNNAAVNNLYLFSAADAGRKLNLQSFDLDTFGALRCFNEIDGEFHLHSTTSSVTDWIYPETGNIVFRGTSRTVVDRESWSGNTINSRFSVIFNTDPGERLTVNAVLKASSFIIQSGIVYQTVNYDGTPATSTFSFNTQDEFGTEDYGTFVIEAGATLVTEATLPYDQIIRRSATRPASAFILREGGNLVFLGEEPIIDAVLVELEGNVLYAGDGPSQNFVSNSMASAQKVEAYNHLYLFREAIKNLPELLVLSGNLTYLGGGGLQDNNSTVVFNGSSDQFIGPIFIQISNVEIQKPVGTLFLQEDLEVLRDFSMVSGDIDFGGNSLTINSSLLGSYSYQSGSWHNLSQLHYINLPLIFDALNGNFPFYDSELGQKRTLALRGEHSQTNQNLSINYIQEPGVDWDPNFMDKDSTLILYKLNSHFHFSGLDPGGEPIEVWIQADELILDEIDDLRVVAENSAADGDHLPAEVQEGTLWGKRRLNFNELNNSFLTLGSTGILSVLPIEWMQVSATEENKLIIISWQSRGKNNDLYVIYRSIGGIQHFSPIGELHDATNEHEWKQFSFTDQLPISNNEDVYYQIKVTREMELIHTSPVFKLSRPASSLGKISLFPNPYREGEIAISIGTLSLEETVIVEIHNSLGKSFLEWNGKTRDMVDPLRQKLTHLPPGLYFIQLVFREKKQSLKWIKEGY